MWICVICVCMCLLLCVYFHLCVYVPMHLCLYMYAHMCVYVFPLVLCVLVYLFNIDVWLNRSVYLSFFLGVFFFLRKGCRNIWLQQAFEQGRKIPTQQKCLSGWQPTTYLQEQNSVWQNLAHSTLPELCGPPFPLVQNCWDVMKAGTWALCCLDKNKKPSLGRWQLATCSQPHHIRMDTAFAHFTWSQEVSEWAGTCTHIDVL